MSCPSRCATALIAVCVVLPSHADTVSNEPIVVTATRTAQTADETLAPVIVITRADIEANQAADLTELLRFYAGLDVARSGGPGQSTSLFLRGTESNHVLLLLDGVKLNPGTIGAPPYQNIRPELIDHIEIVKGPRSTLYGSDAIGGVINIITRRAAAGTAFNAGVGYGSHNTRSADASVQHSADGLRAGLDVNDFATDGFPTYAGSSTDRGHDNASFNAYIGHRYGPVDVELSHWQAQGRTEYTETNYDPNTFAFLGFSPVDENFHNSVSALTFKAAPSQDWASTVKLSHSEDTLDQNQSADFAVTRRNILDFQNDVALGPHQLLSAGLNLQRETTRALSFGTSFDEDTPVDAVFAQDDLQLGAHHLLIAARRTRHKTAGTHNDYDLEYGYQVSTATRLTATVGTAFRAPDSTDRFGFGGNPNLRPEISRNIEIGLRHNLTERQRLTFNAFDNHIGDLINFAFDPNTNAFQATNVDHARIRGLEAGYHYNAESWSARLDAIAQEPHDSDTGKQLLRRARRSLSAAIAYQLASYQLGTELLVSGPRPDVDAITFADTTVGGYALLNLTAATTLTHDWRLDGRIENLFDRSYQQVAGYNTPRRGLFVSLRYSPASGAR